MFTLTHATHAIHTDDIQPSSSLINMPMVDYPDILTYTTSDAQYHAKIITPKYFSAAGYIDYLRDSLDKIKFVDQRAVYELVDLPMVKVIKEVTAAPLQIEETKTIIKTIGMTSQYIYLLQEREFVNSKQNIYKIGMTCQENHKRFNQYKKGSILLFQIICTDCRILEKNIIKIFKEKFKQRKEDVGSESFEGDFKHMIDIIYQCVSQEKYIINSNVQSDLLLENSSDNSTDDSSDNSTDDSSDDSFDESNSNHKFHLLCLKICKIFPDYKNDKSFTPNSNKKYIKLSKGDRFDVIYYINPSLIHDLPQHYNENCESIFCNHIIKQYEMDDRVADRLQYFKMLINKNIICRNKIYDIKSSIFTKKIYRTKFNLKMKTGNEFDYENTSDEEEINDDINTKLRHLFHCNMVIKSKLYATMCLDDDKIDIFKQFKNLKNFSKFSVDVGVRDYKIIDLHKINSKYYYSAYLRKYIPYYVMWDFYNNYYILNRDEFTNLNIKLVKFEKRSDIVLFRDNTIPWSSQENLELMYNKYLETCKTLKLCLNKNKFTDDLLANIVKK